MNEKWSWNSLLKKSLKINRVIKRSTFLEIYRTTKKNISCSEFYSNKFYEQNENYQCYEEKDRCIHYDHMKENDQHQNFINFYLVAEKIFLSLNILLMRLKVIKHERNVSIWIKTRQFGNQYHLLN